MVLTTTTFTHLLVPELANVAEQKRGGKVPLDVSLLVGLNFAGEDVFNLEVVLRVLVETLERPLDHVERQHGALGSGAHCGDSDGPAGKPVGDRPKLRVHLREHVVEHALRLGNDR